MVKSQRPLPSLDTAPPLATANPPMTLFTYADVARLAKVGKQTVYEWVRSGRVPSPIYTGSSARFTEEHVNVILHDRKEPGAYDVQPSPRAEVGKLGATAKLKRKKNRTRKKSPMSDVVTLGRRRPAQLTFDGKRLTVVQGSGKAKPAKKPAKKKGAKK